MLSHMDKMWKVLHHNLYKVKWNFTKLLKREHFVCETWRLSCSSEACTA